MVDSNSKSYLCLRHISFNTLSDIGGGAILYQKMSLSSFSNSKWPSVLDQEVENFHSAEVSAWIKSPTEILSPSSSTTRNP